ncbi:unnamed protein product [marine sediment metagenome]|uniref:Uncharacterized protein n=1 Tax=marine sediment metagenome TaxID=412755 RepID=X0UUI1_9ZZZZ
MKTEHPDFPELLESTAKTEPLVKTEHPDFPESLESTELMEILELQD